MHREAEGMTLENEQHRQFILNAIAAASVQGNLEQLRAFVALADEVESAVKSAAVVAPRAGDDLHS
jgi:hypothetical protein